MMIQLLPYFIKISFKFRGIAGSHRGTHRHGKSNGNDFLYVRRSLAEYNHPVCHTDGFRNIMCD